MYEVNGNASNMVFQNLLLFFLLIQATKNDCFAWIKSIQESNHLIQYLCDIHTLQLVIEDTFKAVEGMSEVLKKCKGLAKLTHTSTTAVHCGSVALQQLKTAAAIQVDKKHLTKIL